MNELSPSERRIRAERYATELQAFKVPTLWTMLQEAVERPKSVPVGMEWRVDVIRIVLVIAEFDGECRCPYDPALYGFSGDALREALRRSARGWQEYFGNDEARETAIDTYEKLAAEIVPDGYQANGTVL